MMSLALVAEPATAVAAVHAPAPPLSLRTLSGTPVARAGPRIVMFWRADCAPCRLELMDIKALRAAAAPMQIDLVGLQPAAALRSGLSAMALPDAESLNTPDDPTRVLTAWGGPPPRLPLAVALDAQGRICARHTGLVGRDRLKAWSRTCGAGHARG